ncbi:hypothetical protein [Treponema zioleckii]|uniref:hypothetical protein n=1 Tax=Treponema zioleckii TaxID=331680 RepID=UPI00168AF003|nr:hypothetical protein [Treponema zioleckii]
MTGSSLTVDGWGRYSVLSFDKKGRLRQEFNADGKCIHAKSSDGTELFFEYDSNGNEIYFKSSDGRERRTVYEYYSNGKIKEAKIFE